MRGDSTDPGPMFSYISAAQRVPAGHPLRRIREMADTALKALSREFDRLYSKVGRPSIPPEHLLRALLLQYFYGIRSERLLMEQLDYNLLFRWFVGLSMDDEVWDASTFSKNRDRLLEGEIAERFLQAVVEQASAKGLTSDEHFSIDGTLIEAWASQKSFKPKGGDKGQGPEGRNPHVDFRGKERKNDTHESTTDPDARLYRKGDGQESKLSYLGHVVMENRHGLVVGCEVTHANGYGEREAGRALMQRIDRKPRVTLGADKGYDTKHFVAECRARNVTPHVAQNAHFYRRSAIDERTTRGIGYELSQRVRKRVEQIFGWMKSAARMRKTRFRGIARTQLAAYFVGAAYNLLRIANLLATPQPA
jgi:transposase